MEFEILSFLFSAARVQKFELVLEAFVSVESSQTSFLPAAQNPVVTDGKPPIVLTIPDIKGGINLVSDLNGSVD